LGGRSPLTHALVLAQKVIRDELQRRREFIPLLVLVSDGKGNVSMNGGDPEEEAKEVAREIRQAGIHSICIDTEKQSLGSLMHDLCTEMGGVYLRNHSCEESAEVRSVSREGYWSLRQSYYSVVSVTLLSYDVLAYGICAQRGSPFVSEVSLPQ